MFTSRPTYSMFRTLYLTIPHQKGEDVYALQTALIACGFALPKYGADGDLGGETSNAIEQAQRALGLIVDGKAGGQTQRAFALRIAKAHGEVPFNALRGSIEHESSYRLGAYSAQYSDGTYDAGVCQCNTGIFPSKDGFNVPVAIEALAERVRLYYDKFVGITDDRRRWALAQGAWNAPAFACWEARQEGASQVKTSEVLQPTPDQRKTFDAYVASVSAYL